MFETIEWGIIAPLIVIELILKIVALISLSRTNTTYGPKWLWILIILIINTIGPVAYFIVGRRGDG
ncbi:PLDc N-terminal domain-containing protein [Thalassobacillus sp. CUG 92003]|uniref:PLDc N-terminal domain-containing protein n=1 Tax=Thalassobacillus sp. CUG 92003 TaxID=2736641 RepID=UPI0015E70810|nr:PLDc N-terminal domain-containing protein [Thalassobacillus sp. CUG 92003]